MANKYLSEGGDIMDETAQDSALRQDTYNKSSTTQTNPTRNDSLISAYHHSNSKNPFYNDKYYDINKKNADDVKKKWPDLDKYMQTKFESESVGQIDPTLPKNMMPLYKSAIHKHGNSFTKTTDAMAQKSYMDEVGSNSDIAIAGDVIDQGQTLMKNEVLYNRENLIEGYSASLMKRGKSRK